MWKKVDEIPAHNASVGHPEKFDPFEPFETFVTYCEGLALEGEQVRLIAGLESATLAREDVLGWRAEEDHSAYEVRIRNGAKILVHRAVIAEPGAILFGPFGEQPDDHGHGHDHERHCHDDGHDHVHAHDGHHGCHHEPAHGHHVHGHDHGCQHGHSHAHGHEGHGHVHMHEHGHSHGDDPHAHEP